MYKVKVINTNEIFECEDKAAIEIILNKVADKLEYPAYLAKVDNAYRALSHLLSHDCEVEFLDIRNQACWEVYQNSLVLLFNKAVKDLYVDGINFSVNNSLNKGLFITTNKELFEEDLLKIENHMEELVEKDIKILKHHLSLEEAKALATKLKHRETIALLDTIESVDDVQIYSLDNEMEFLFTQTVPSTKYLQFFKLEKFKKGFILKYPHQDNPVAIPEKTEQTILYNAFKEASEWGRILNVKYMSDMNATIDNNKMEDLILLQEALHEKKISDIADDIKKLNRRIVLICGPSSSGKTTFAKRLCIQLEVNGLKTLYLGTDDYFVEQEEKPRNPDGTLDLESIRAVDTKLFISNMKDLLNGKTVDMPIFDFNTNHKIFGKRITKLDCDQVIVVEGIHALNKLLTQGIPEKEKYKIYISPFTPLGIEHHNRIPTTDARMLRRLVRDHQFRNRTPENVMDEWIKVREGENKNIFPFHVEADTFFNSNCIYELNVLKKYAQPLLEQITRDKPQYAEAQRMISFLKFIDPIKDDSLIPNTSIMREFIGGSIIVK